MHTIFTTPYKILCIKFFSLLIMDQVSLYIGFIIIGVYSDVVCPQLSPLGIHVCGIVTFN